MAGPGKVGGSNTSRVPAPRGSAPCFFPRGHQRMAHLRPPSPQKEEGRRWHPRTPERHTLSPCPQPTSTSISLRKPGPLVAGSVAPPNGVSVPSGRERRATGKGSRRVHGSMFIVIDMPRLQWNKLSSLRPGSTEALTSSEREYWQPFPSRWNPEWHRALCKVGSDGIKIRSLPILDASGFRIFSYKTTIKHKSKASLLKQNKQPKKKKPTFITRFVFSLKLSDHSPMEKGNFLVQHIAKSTPYWIKKERREERKAGGKTAIFILLIKQNNKEVPLQHRGLRIHRCRRAGSIPDLGTSTCWGYGQHTNQPRRIGGWLFILTNGFPYVIFNRRSHSIFTNSMYIPPYTNTGTL